MRPISTPSLGPAGGKDTAAIYGAHRDIVTYRILPRPSSCCWERERRRVRSAAYTPFGTPMLCGRLVFLCRVLTTTTKRAIASQVHQKQGNCPFLVFDMAGAFELRRPRSPIAALPSLEQTRCGTKPRRNRGGIFCFDGRRRPRGASFTPVVLLVG